MAASQLGSQLADHVASMVQQGMLDEQFHDIEKLKLSNIGFMTRYIATFFTGVEKKFALVDIILNEEKVNFLKLQNLVCQIKSSSNMMGARNMKNAIIPLLHFSKTKDKNRFRIALEIVKLEYQQIRSQLEVILKLEQIIRNIDDMA